MQQLGLFEDEIKPQVAVIKKVNAPIVKKEIFDPAIHYTHIVQGKKHVTDEYIEEYLSIKANIWDMRCWKALKDPVEIKEKLLQIKEVHNPHGFLNDGHAAWLVQLYLAHHKDDTDVHDKLTDMFMKNKNVSWQKRITSCMIDSLKCPIFVSFLNYADCHCTTRCNT